MDTLNPVGKSGQEFLSPVIAIFLMSPFTASTHDAYFICYDGNCSQSKVLGFYGTSGSTPSMAGIMSLVNQTLGERQGNFNPTLYALAATPSNGVFNDVTLASSGVTDCNVDAPSMCDNSISLASGSTPPHFPVSR